MKEIFILQQPWLSWIVYEALRGAILRLLRMMSLLLDRQKQDHLRACGTGFSTHILDLHTPARTA